MNRKGWLTVGLAVMLGAGYGGAASAHGQDVIDDGTITEHRAQVEQARWGDQSGEKGEIESPRWGDQSGEKGEIESPRWGDQSGEKGEVESPRWGDQSGEKGEVESPRT